MVLAEILGQDLEDLDLLSGSPPPLKSKGHDSNPLLDCCLDRRVWLRWDSAIFTRQRVGPGCIFSRRIVSASEWQEPEPWGIFLLHPPVKTVFKSCKHSQPSFHFSKPVPYLLALQNGLWINGSLGKQMREMLLSEFPSKRSTVYINILKAQRKLTVYKNERLLIFLT